MVHELFVWPIWTLLSFSHTKLNGPVPDGVVLNKAVVPGQLVRLVKGVAVTLVRTVKVALFVTLPHAPLTVTLYVPASIEATDVSESALLVWPLSTVLPFRHTKPNGPLPDGVVL